MSRPKKQKNRQQGSTVSKQTSEQDQDYEGRQSNLGTQSEDEDILADRE